MNLSVKALRTLIIALAGLAVGAPTAHAGTLAITGPNQITFTATPGEKNFVSVNWGNVGAGPDFIPTFSDFYTPTLGPGCDEDGRCPAAGTNPTYIIHLGDG